MVVTVCADGSKPPLLFVTSGKTMRCTYKLGVNEPHVCSYTESGWMRAGVMETFFDSIIYPITGGDNCMLLLDSYKAHIKPEVYAAAERYNIELVVVPACMTSSLSPLDVGVNGPLKSMYSKMWRHERLFNNIYHTKAKPAYSEAIRFACIAFDTITSSTVKQSFASAVQLPPDTSLTLDQLESTERVLQAEVAVQQHRPRVEPPLARSSANYAPRRRDGFVFSEPSRRSSRIANVLSNPTINDQIIARALVDNSDEL